MTRRPVPLARLEGLLASGRGLTVGEASERRRRYGPNDIAEAPPGRWWDLARDTVRDPMIWFLAGVSALYAVVGETAEALVLLAAIAPLAGMDAFLHRRTQASTQSLRSRLAERATVVRDGVSTEVLALEVTPGDLAVVSPAEAFPADGIIVGGSDLQADESSLTGEAYPAAKRPLTGSPGPGVEPPVDAAHWGFAGTRLLTGRAVLRVVFTGAETLYGEIVRSAVHGSHARTPLQSAIQHLVSVLLVAAAVVCAILAGVRMVQGHGWLDALLSAVTLAAAAIPEEFPVVFAFFLGVGVYRLARRQALVRRAVAVENIGRVTAICSDKTGTITEGRLRLTHLVAADPLSDAELLALAAAASRRDSGDPLDEAVLREADAAGAGKNGREVLATFPFTESRKRETAIARDPGGNTVAVTKGAAETILAMSEAEAAEVELWNGRVARLAEDGHKVIACAWRPLDEGACPGGEPDQGYRLAGLLAFEDPVRGGVAEAIGACRHAGVHAIMVTGDHPLTARAVAREVGLGVSAQRVVSGDDMEALVARGEGRALRDIDVVARATPAQKLTLVRALQALHEIVAVTGDGVNDVPALQAADVGIAMGERGTRSAREVAALVLLDDNFRTIVGAIAEGRQLFQNLRTSFAYLLMIHLPFVASALVVPLLGYPLLYLPVHIVWIELILHPTALLVFQEMPAGRLVSWGAQGGPPMPPALVAPRRSRGAPRYAGGLLEFAERSARTRFFAPREWTTIALVGGVIALVAIGAYAWNVQERGSAEHGRAMAIATLAFASVALTARLSGLRTRTTRVIAAATAASTIIAIQTPLLAAMLHLQPLHPMDWGVAIAGSLLAAGLSWGSPGGRAPRAPEAEE